MIFTSKLLKLGYQLSILVIVSGLAPKANSFLKLKNLNVQQIIQPSTTSLKMKVTSNSPNQQNLSPYVNTQELNSRLDTMPIAEKYTLLIESYTKDILISKKYEINKEQLMESIESLYTEMAQQPSVFKSEFLDKATSSLLTSASFFFNTIQLGQAIQLAKAGTYV